MAYPTVVFICGVLYVEKPRQPGDKYLTEWVRPFVGEEETLPTYTVVDWTPEVVRSSAEWHNSLNSGIKAEIMKSLYNRVEHQDFLFVPGCPLDIDAHTIAVFGDNILEVEKDFAHFVDYLRGLTNVTIIPPTTPLPGSLFPDDDEMVSDYYRENWSRYKEMYSKPREGLYTGYSLVLEDDITLEEYHG